MTGAQDIVDALVTEAGPSTALLVIEERTVPRSLGETVGELATDAVASLVGGTSDAMVEGEAWATFVTAVDSQGKTLAERRVDGQSALMHLPAAIRFARAAGRTVDLRTPGRNRRFIGPSVLGVLQEPHRSEAELVAKLREGGWHVAVEQQATTLMRGRAGRELGLAFLMVLLATIFLPISAIVVAVAAIRGPDALRSLLDQWKAPFRRIDERIRIEIRPGALRWAIWRNGAVTIDRALDPNGLLAVHADGPFDEAVLLIGPTATEWLPCLARGEPRQSFSPPQSDAVADLIVRIWAKPAPGYRG